MPKDKLVKIGALWVSKTGEGKKMLSGKMGDAKMLVFENGYKKSDNQPDYIVYVTNPERKEKNGESNPPPPDGYHYEGNRLVPDSGTAIDDDIPF